MALKHFLVTIPLSSLVLTFFFYYTVPVMGVTLQWYEMLAIISVVNIIVTVIAILLVPSQRFRGPRK